MRKLIQKVSSYFKRKAYQESNEVDIDFAEAQQNTDPNDVQIDTNSFSGKLPNNIIIALKKAKEDVLELENTLKEIKQNKTI